MEPYSVDQFTSKTIISVSANQVLLDTTVKRVSYYTELYFSCISFYSLLVILLINCPMKIKYYHNISRAQSHLILRELLWHAFSFSPLLVTRTLSMNQFGQLTELIDGRPRFTLETVNDL